MKKKKVMIHLCQVLVKIAGILILLTSLAVSAGAAETKTIKNRINVGFNYPGFSFRYGIADNIAAEFKIQMSDDVYVLGPRVYAFFSRPAVNTGLYLGMENAVIFFEGEDSEGKGLAQVLFAGAEYNISSVLSISADIGPALLMLSDSDTSQSAFSTSMIGHISINYFLR